MKGKIIVIEGIDGSGKNTQALELSRYLSDQDVKNVVLHFPLYEETFFGQEVARYLNGFYGKLNEIHPKLSALLYAGDRFEKKEYLYKELEEGTVIILDRYVPSNMAHHSAKLPIEDRKEFINWIKKLEYEVFGLPKPDFVIFLNMEPNISQSLVLTKSERTYTKKKQDLHEENLEYLSEVYKTFKKLACDENWYTINCNNGQSPKNIKEISNEMCCIISSYLKI